VDSPSSSTHLNPQTKAGKAAKRTGRAPRLPGYKPKRVRRSKLPAQTSGRDNVLRGKRHRPANVDEIIAIFSRHGVWANIKTKTAAKLRSMGVPEDSLAEVTDSVVRRLLEGRMKGNGTVFETVKWVLSWEIVTYHVFQNIAGPKKRRLRLFCEQLAALGLKPNGARWRAAFYTMWGLGNREIGKKIGVRLDVAKEHVIALRRKLGIPAVGLDDRVATVCGLLGLHENEERRVELLSERMLGIDLSERERTVAFCIVSGLGYKQIAEKIHRSEPTVKNSAESLRRKLGIPPVGKDDRVTTVLNLLGL
jgi:DNA-binding CsgD family transcriptional regulator